MKRPSKDLPGPGLSTRSLLTGWALPAVVFALGAALSLASFTSFRSREREARRLEFERQAGQVAVAARVSFDIPLEVLRSVPALFESSEEVTRAEFRSFVRDSLARYSWIYALEWIPRVPGSERARYEAAAAADGFPGYHFKQDAPSGPPVRAEPRQEYFPLYYMEPPNLIALGLEETALDARRVALERARDLDATIVTERLKLVQDDPSVASVIAFHPIYRRGERPATMAARRESLRGFAAVVFRVRPVIANALRDTDLEAVDVVLLDADAPEERAVLYESRPEAYPLDRERASHEHEANIAGRRWKFLVSDRANWAKRDAGFPWLATGLLASLLAAAFAQAARAIFRLRRMVRAAEHLGQYTLVEKLGEGGMGTVYRAHHALLRRPTAIKLMHPSRRGSAALARFEREVQLTSALTHPNTVVVYDYGHTESGVFYYAMEYIDGITLQELVDLYGPQPPERVVAILEQISAALAEAHAIGLVHRDVKPANVMLCNRGGSFDFAKVLDFGLAKEQTDGAATQVSHASVVIGTPLYLAPEAITGKRPVDARADIYALGAVAYFLLTGGPVFSGSTVVEICAKHLSTPPEPFASRLGPGVVPAALEALVMRCLAKDPEQRPDSGGELVQALRALDVPRWSRDQAERWWQQHGPALEKRLADARRSRERPPTGSTIEIDPRRRMVEKSVEQAF
jgi:serine/threonine protein kinase/CHASE1-domain containing sensor protein